MQFSHPGLTLNSSEFCSPWRLAHVMQPTLPAIFLQHSNPPFAILILLKSSSVAYV